MRRIISLSLSLAAAAALAACAGYGKPAAPSATAEVQPTQGNHAAGSVRFEQQADAVLAKVHVTGLKPGAEHGFHLHEKGDCSAPDGTSAGGHFNPAGTPHGPQEGPHHGGDMPALKADASGVADASFTLHGITVGSGAANDVAGRAVIVHANPDDYKTQPTGNSGARIGCGVVKPS